MAGLRCGAFSFNPSKSTRLILHRKQDGAGLKSANRLGNTGVQVLLSDGRSMLLVLSRVARATQRKKVA